jgi:hypothetical protein
MPDRTAYCTILSSNYLPKALALAESLRRHEDGARLKILFIDHPSPATLPVLDGVDVLSTAVLGLTEREVLDLATGYDLVEFATAVKPLLLKELLRDAEAAIYLDPDTFLTTPLVELPGALAASEGGILLTPHFLHPTGPDAEMGDGHMLAFGVYNLGFCAVDRRALAMLDWWWGHLEHECLFDPLSGLFVDQKWMDLGSTLFGAAAFRHSGYNVGITNVSERPIAVDADGYYNSANGDRLRLFHFHAFDSKQPETLSPRFRSSIANPLHDESAVLALSKAYAEVLVRFEGSLPPAPPYPYHHDTTGKLVTRQLRRAHRLGSTGPGSLPSPFVPEEAAAFAKWRRKATRTKVRALAADAAKCVRIVLPENYDQMRARFPKLAERLNDRFSSGKGMWG